MWVLPRKRSTHHTILQHKKVDYHLPQQPEQGSNPDNNDCKRTSGCNKNIVPSHDNLLFQHQREFGSARMVLVSATKVERILGVTRPTEVEEEQ